MFFTMQQYFYRSNHRHRFSAIQFCKVCPGGVFCGEILHWVLIIFELAGAMIIGYALMPMIANARVRYAYESTTVRKTVQSIKNEADDETDSPVKPKGSAKKRVLDKKAAKKVAPQEIVPEEPTKPVKDQPPAEFRGTMDEGMKFMQIIGFMMLVCSAIFVCMT